MMAFQMIGALFLALFVASAMTGQSAQGR